MAEGGNFSKTLESGSEALFDHECTECRAHGSKQEATDFCQDCKQLLCTICVRYHIRYMKTHTLVGFTSLKQPKTILPTVCTVPGVAKCPYHPDRDNEIYCGTHAMVCGCRCIAIEHRKHCSCGRDTELDTLMKRKLRLEIRYLEWKIDEKGPY